MADMLVHVDVDVAPGRDTYTYGRFISRMLFNLVYDNISELYKVKIANSLYDFSKILTPEEEKETILFIAMDQLNILYSYSGISSSLIQNYNVNVQQNLLHSGKIKSFIDNMFEKNNMRIHKIDELIKLYGF